MQARPNGEARFAGHDVRRVHSGYQGRWLNCADGSDCRAPLASHALKISCRVVAALTVFDIRAVGFDDGAIRHLDEGINDRRRRLATTEMRLDGGLGGIRQYEAGDS